MAECLSAEIEVTFSCHQLFDHSPGESTHMGASSDEAGGMERGGTGEVLGEMHANELHR